MIREPLIVGELVASPICLGTMNFGNPVGEPAAVELIRAARGRGINFIDTANMYEGYDRTPGSPGGVAERIVGAAVADRRDEYVIATKVGMKVGDRPEDEYTSPAAIRGQLSRSLRNLGTDYVDIYYLHRQDPHTRPEDICQELLAHLDAGSIRSYGVSNFSALALLDLLDAAARVGAPPPLVCSPPLSLIRSDAARDLLPLCVERGVAVVPYQVLEGGVLTGKYRRGRPAPPGTRRAEMPDWVADLADDGDELVDRIDRLAERLGRSMTQYSVAWALGQPGVRSVIVGARRVDQLVEILAALEQVPPAVAG